MSGNNKIQLNQLLHVGLVQSSRNCEDPNSFGSFPFQYQDPEVGGVLSVLLEGTHFDALPTKGSSRTPPQVRYGAQTHPSPTFSGSV